MSDTRPNIKEMLALCYSVAGVKPNQVQIIAHEVRPGSYCWLELQFPVAGAPQVSIMPAPVSSLEGDVYEYIGTTTSQYKNGYCYNCSNYEPRCEYIDFYNLTESYPRPRHRIRKLMGTWKNLY
jgi:hypothetical protein